MFDSQRPVPPPWSVSDRVTLPYDRQLTLPPDDFAPSISSGAASGGGRNGPGLSRL